MYCIIDIETTGGNSVTDRITEIAIYKHDGNEIVDQFCSLINPERRIPHNISILTGITDQMVADAPKFYEVAKRIVEITEDAVFVAHNSRFDYNFVRNAFKSLGYEYKREQLCTVRLSRKLLPGHKSYSLGKLCNELGIDLENRHRASGDALATVKLFELLLDKQEGEITAQTKKLDFEALGLHRNISKELLDEIPRHTGVYYFFNEEDYLIYVGKSVDIRSRIISHLNNSTTRRAIEMRQNIARIDWELTGSELVALLKESEEIKLKKPFYNRAQRRSAFTYGLFAGFSAEGYITFQVKKIGKNDSPVTGFSSKKESLAAIARMMRKFTLCQKFSGLYKSEGACFHYHIGKCEGACTGEEGVKEYNERAREALQYFQLRHQNLIILDKGRQEDEKAVVAIENGRYLGFGFASLDFLEYNVEWLKNCINPALDNRDVRGIIRGYLGRKTVEKVIEY